jgi:hypothetical protein
LVGLVTPVTVRAVVLAILPVRAWLRVTVLPLMAVTVVPAGMLALPLIVTPTAKRFEALVMLMDVAPLLAVEETVPEVDASGSEIVPLI